MKFNLLNHTLEICEGKKNYLKIISDFASMAEEAQNHFSMEIANLLMELHSENPLNYYYEEYIAKTRKYLAQYGVYTLSDNEILQSIVSDNQGKTFLEEESCSVILQVTEDALENNEVGNDLYFLRKIEKIIKSGHFNSAIWKDIMSLCDYVLNYLIDNELAEIQMVYQKDSDKATAIYQNFLSGAIPATETESLAVSMIELDFSERSYYAYIFENFSQSRYEIAAITMYLGIDISDLIEKDIKKRFNLNQLTCEAEALKVQEELRIVMENYNITTCTREKELEKMLVEFDIKARTFDGVLYETREEQKQAVADDAILSNLCGNIEKLDKEACKQLIQDIEAKSLVQRIQQKYITLLRQQIHNVDIAYLEQVTGDLSKNSEEQCNEIKATIMQYDAPEKDKADYIKRVEDRVLSIWEEEDFAKFSQLFLNTPSANREIVSQNANLVNKTGRTSNKTEIYMAFIYLREDEILNAAKYALAKESGMFASFINIGKKESYKILTLNERVMHPDVASKIEELRVQKSSGFLSGLKKSIWGGSKAQTPTAPAKFCSNCGAKLDSSSTFCSACGNNVK